MSFYFSDTVVLLFDFWSVHSPLGKLPASACPTHTLCPSVHPSIHCQLCSAPRERVWGRGTSSGFAFLSGAELGLELGKGLEHKWFWYHVGQTLFHVVQVVLGYMVMLAVMSYNAWIFLGAIVGSTLGYFVVYPLL
ncbi:COPT2 protein, partial [Nyctiprogne leucopyga]|nr:COPT2 protein [Nyctiprogne leucopyga]